MDRFTRRISAQSCQLCALHVAPVYVSDDDISKEDNLLDISMISKPDKM